MKELTFIERLVIDRNNLCVKLVKQGNKHKIFYEIIKKIYLYK